MKRFLAILSACVVLGACRPDTYVPKPRGYYHIELPERKYQQFDDPAYPYSFEYPVYSHIVPDTNFFGKKPENPYWINVEFPSLGGSLYVSYKTIAGEQTLDRLIEDAYQMTEFHTKRADNIEPFVFHNDSARVHGIVYSVTGNAASAYQFYATDSTHHYLRGALYFDVSPNADSLLPVNDFIKEDMEHMLKTLRWK
jgi:gliding motility-associated lipoprotein GldD